MAPLVGTAWPQRLRRQVDQGGAGARRAHRDLDAICALFEIAARAVEQRDHVGVAAFFASLVAQQIPADTLAERGVRGSAVRLLTAHRSKGLEWELVVVAHVQQEGWPDLRRRATLLGADRIGVDASGTPDLVPPVTARALLMEERRLFYVACTRARRRLVVTAVKSTDDDGEQPSRFLERARASPSTTATAGRRGRCRWAAWSPSCAATAADPAASPAAARGRRPAPRRARGRGRRAAASSCPQADPATWWGTRARRRRSRAGARPGATGPGLGQHARVDPATCPAQWFFEREAGGVSAAHQSANLGQIVHAARRAGGRRRAARPTVDTLMAEVDAVWDRLAFRTPVVAPARARPDPQGARPLRRSGTAPTRASSSAPSSASARGRASTGSAVTLNGYADRLEIDADGDVVVVDLKTARTAPTGPGRRRQPPARALPVRRRAGALDEAAGRPTRVRRRRARAARHPRRHRRSPRSRRRTPSRRRARARAAARPAWRARPTLVRAENFPAVAGPHCRDCAFVADLPGQGRGIGDRPVTDARRSGSSTPAELQALMGGHARQPEQWAGDHRAAAPDRRGRRRRAAARPR